jgi:hypothetical protein
VKAIDLLFVKRVLLRLDDKVWLDSSFWIRFAPCRKIVDPSEGDISAAQAEFGNVNLYVREEIALLWLTKLVFVPVSPCLVNN